MSQPQFDPALLLAHLQHLSVQIGGRGSCTAGERLASEYAAGQFAQLGLQPVHRQTFQAVPSTYWPYAISFAAALSGVLLALLAGMPPPLGPALLCLAAILNGLGAWGMLAETEFTPSWTRSLLPRRPSQNVSTAIPGAGSPARRVVIAAHIDTHRTPVFYSSPRWHALFGLLIGLAFLSMAAGAILFGLAALPGLNPLRWVGLLLAPVQLFALLMCLHADFTPYSPGANDNASGAAAALAIAERLAGTPLARTEVHIVLTGCEEVGDAGMSAYLDAHAASLGPDTIYLIIDEIGLGDPKYLTTDGLLRKIPTHPAALALAQAAAAARPDLGVISGPGLAYTDALVATRRGLPAITLCAVPPPNSALTSHWHQMGDTVEQIEMADLLRACDFAWQILLEIDAQM